jgi:hypothetical protein
MEGFYPGALLRRNGRLDRIADPFRRPIDALGAVIAPMGTLVDELRAARLRRAPRRSSIDEIFRGLSSTTLDALRVAGFSDSIVDGFFRLFFAGVSIDDRLETSRRMFKSEFKMLS